MKKPTKLLLTILPVFVLFAATTFTLLTNTTYAATLTVNSTADDEDNDGECTLREAITAANDDTASGLAAGECAAGSGADTINFNIAGGGVRTIQPGSELPAVTEQLNINGYSQPGTQANTNPSPQALNSTLLIELNGDNAGAVGALSFGAGSDSSEIRGLIVNGFDSGVAISVDDITVEGNYIGTNSSGTAAEEITFSGVNFYDDSSEGLVGGSTAASRNLISGNGANGVIIDGGANTNIDILGNYIGINKSGTSAIPNGIAGILMVTSTDIGDINIGGPTPSMGNVISGNLAGGIRTDIPIDNLLVQNNYVGVGADGTTDIGNGTIGITAENNSVIKDNVVSGNTSANITIGGAGNTIQSNFIGTTANGGIDSGITQSVGVAFTLATAIATDNILGGTSASEANTIAGNGGAGVASTDYSIPSIPLTAATEKNAILGNSIYGNGSGSFFGQSLPGLGIELFTIELDGTFAPNGSDNTGPTPNDSGDPDTGANGYINFPVLNSVIQDGSQAKINFDLDAADSPVNQYRVEFFSNDTPDPSGYGEGQTYLGSTIVSNGTNQQQTITLPTGTDLTNKHISATTTAIDSTTNSGFGSTSEFSLIKQATVTTANTTNNSTLANTGTNIYLLYTISTVILLAGGVKVLQAIRY